MGVLIAFALAFIYPFVLSAFTVFKTLPDIAANPVRLLPSPEYGWSMQGIEGLNRGNIRIPRWAVNSVFVTVSVVLGRVLLCSLAGYALARMRFIGRTFVFALVVAVLAIPAIVLAIPALHRDEAAGDSRNVFRDSSFPSSSMPLASS